MKQVVFLLSLCMLGLWAGCSDDDSTTTSSGSVASLSDVPGATTPVDTDYSGDPRIRNRSIRDASTGKILATAAMTDFSGATQPSRGACEAFNMLRQTYENAARPDKIKCYIGKILENSAISGVSESDIDTTGGYNYFTVGNQGSVKFKLKKEAGVVTEFEMFECMDNGSSQSGYIHTTLVNGSMDMSVKSIGSWENGSYSNQFTVTGEMDGTTLVSKQLTNIYEHAWTGDFVGSGYGKVVVDEYASTFKINAFNHQEGRGSWGSNNYANQQEVTAFGVVQLLNSTAGQLDTLAAGDGSLRATLSGANMINQGTNAGDSAASLAADLTSCLADGITSQNGCWNQSETITQTWTGDDLEAGTFGASSYGYDEVNATTPELTQADPTIAFTDAESWDCSDTEDQTAQTVTMSAAMETVMSECDDTYGFGSEGGHLDCWQLDRQ